MTSGVLSLPTFYSRAAAEESRPDGWDSIQVDDAIEHVKQGPRFDQKSVTDAGQVPVLDQSADGVIGFHDGAAGVEASNGLPVVTFANHTCNLRFMTGSFSTIQNVFAFRGRAGLSDTRFLYYWLQGRISTDEYKGFFPTLRAQWLHIPPLDEQRRIAGVLGALDDLIEVNRGLIADLDAALSASWKMAASRNSLSISFGEVAVAGKGLSYKGAYLTDRGIPMINMGSFGVDGNYREHGLKWYVEEEVKAKHRLVQGDLVIVNTDLTQSRDILARPVIVPFEHATSTHHTYQVKVPGGEAQRFWIYCALRQESVRQRLISYSTGTTVAALPLDALTSQEIPWSEPLAIENWWKDTEPLYSSQLQLREEMQDLVQARDELLPLLMSGRVRVGEDGVAA